MSVPVKTEKLQLPEGADPIAILNNGLVYSKDVAGITQLFYMASDGTITQLTPAGSIPTFVSPTTQRFIAAGGETDFFVVLTTPRANDVYSVFWVNAGMATIIALDLPDLAAGDRTTVQFRVVTSAPLTAGDIIDFLIVGR